MTIDRKKVLSEGRDLFFFLLASVAQTYLLCPRCNSLRSYVLVASFTFLMWVLLWKGNSLLAHVISKNIPWITFPVKRFFIGVISTISYTVAAVVGVMLLFQHFFSLSFGSGFIYTVYGSVLITIVISLFLHGREFLLHWRQATLDKEKFEKASIEARYESLKNQVNPHFLFNSLNALSNLVYEDPEKAVKFIKQLSEVYRYVLQTRDQEVVTLEDELRFLEAYLYLQKIRFGDKLNIHVSVSDHTSLITPLALQMLIENAIKHNVVSEEEPLNVNVSQDDRYLVVENNIQKRKTMAEPSSGVGLENICKRYELLTERKVEIHQGPEKFTVRVPLLTNSLS